MHIQCMGQTGFFLTVAVDSLYWGSLIFSYTPLLCYIDATDLVDLNMSDYTLSSSGVSGWSCFVPTTVHIMKSVFSQDMSQHWGVTCWGNQSNQKKEETANAMKTTKIKKKDR